MRKNVITLSLFPATVPDKVEVWQGGGRKKGKENERQK